MRILLRDLEHGHFYAGRETWTTDATLAEDFESTARAIDFVSDTKLSGVEIVMRFDNPSFEIALSIVGTGCSGPELINAKVPASNSTD